MCLVAVLSQIHMDRLGLHMKEIHVYFFLCVYICIFYLYTLVYIYICTYLCGKLLASDDVVRNVMDDVAWVGKERSYISSLFCKQKISIKIESGRLDNRCSSAFVSSIVDVAGCQIQNGCRIYRMASELTNSGFSLWSACF